MKITVTTTIDIEPGGDQKARIKEIGVDLSLPLCLDRSAYYEKDHPNARGVQAITSTLVQGLLANIHGAHQHGTRDSAEHLRYIIAELERGFVKQVKVV